MNERIKILKQYLEEDPEDAFSRYALALELIREKNDTEASVMMDHLYRQHPEYLPNYYHYGKLQERLGNTGFSISLYSKGIELARQQGNLHTLNELRTALDLLESD
jgi:tetratricopeptide (TPR) repeat protein